MGKRRPFQRSRFFETDASRYVSLRRRCRPQDSATEWSFDNGTGNVVTETLYGEVTGSDDGTFVDAGTDKRTNSTSYVANGADYIHGLVAHSTTTNNNGTRVAEQKFYYDSLNIGSVTEGNLTKREDWVTGTTYVDMENTYNGTYGLITEKKGSSRQGDHIHA